MGTWNSRGLRGSVLEEMINYTNEKYRDRKLALIQKIPTPITPVRFDKASRHITLAYFDQRSTVDYMGVVQGIPVCFDAKECAVDSFPLQNFHEHQIRFMRDYEDQGGISFFLLYFTHRRQCYYLRLRDFLVFYERMKAGGLKHFKYSELNPDYFVPASTVYHLHYLENIQKDLQDRASLSEDGSHGH